MEPGGAPSLPKESEKLARLAAIAEAVSKQKRAPSSTSADTAPANTGTSTSDIVQQSNSTAPSSIADTLRRKSVGMIASTLSQNDVETTATATADTTTNNPTSRFELPLTMASMRQAREQSQTLHQHQSSSSFSRKRPRVEYGFGNEEQRAIPSMIGFGQQIIHHQQQLQRRQQQYQLQQLQHQQQLHQQHHHQQQQQQQQQQQPYYYPQYQQQHLNQLQQHQYQHLQQHQHQNQPEQSIAPTSRTLTATALPVTQPSIEGVRFREYQAEIWSEKFEELCTFRRFHGHCHVPHHYNQNTGLAQWVKRQRYQYKLKLDNKRSTLSDERVRLLNKIGFIWNSHDAVWEERLQDLMGYKRTHGHCIVPSNFESNPQLAVWTKRQRRQYKKYQDGTSSSMTPERIAKLENIGFVWDCRKINKAEDVRGDVQGVGESAAAAAAAALSSSVSRGLQWPNAIGMGDTGRSSGVGVGSRLESFNIDTNTGMGRGQVLSSRGSRWNNPLLHLPTGRSSSDQRLGTYSSSVEQDVFYKTRDKSAAISGSLTTVDQGHINTKATPSRESTGDATGRKPSPSTVLYRKDDTAGSVDEYNSESTLLGEQQPLRKTPKCEFFSFSRRYSNDDKKKPAS